MSSIEFGYKPAGYEDDPDEAKTAVLMELKEATEKMKSECSHVYEDPDNGDKLDQLLADAEEFYDVNEAGWQKLLNDTKFNLIKAGDDPEKIEDILRAAISEGASELM